jgi:hypothetical protein
MAKTKNETCHGTRQQAWAEARQLFDLLRLPGQSVQLTRKQILPNPGTYDETARFRLAVLVFFNQFVAAGKVLAMRQRRRTQRVLQIKNQKPAARQRR